MEDENEIFFYLVYSFSVCQEKGALNNYAIYLKSNIQIHFFLLEMGLCLFPGLSSKVCINKWIESMFLKFLEQCTPLFLYYEWENIGQLLIFKKGFLFSHLS